MSLAVGYSDSDSDDAGPVPPPPPPPPPADILNKFSKMPLRVGGKRTATDGTSRKETTFVYVSVTPDAGLLSRIETILESVRKSLDRPDQQLLQLHNLSVNKLTGGPSTLHVSLCHNMILSSLDLDALIEYVLSDTTVAAIRFPLTLRFQPDVHLLYNDDRSRCFVALRLVSECVAVLRPLVELLNAYSGTLYDPASLHVSVGVLSSPGISSLPATLRLPACTRPGPVKAESAELTRGRSVVTLLPRPASASQAAGRDGQVAGGKEEAADIEAGRKRRREGEKGEGRWGKKGKQG